MKILCLLSFLTIVNFVAIGQDLKVMTYNIRLDLQSDAENKWDNRKESLIRLINYYEPEIFGVQEAQHHQLMYLNDELKNYAYIGVGRDDGKTGGEYSAVFFDSTKYSVSRDTTIWLNENGEVGRLGWDAAFPRICTYGLFESVNTHQKFWMFNAHFDHKGDIAREESANLILRTVEKVNAESLPVILTGDFNLTPETKPIRSIKAKLTDTFDATKKPSYGPVGTFSGFDPAAVLKDKIDYIFVKGFEVESERHIDDRRNDNYFVSDHLPILCELKAIR